MVSVECFISCESVLLSDVKLVCCNKVWVILNKFCCLRLFMGVYDMLFFQENIVKWCENGKWIIGISCKLLLDGWL